MAAVPPESISRNAAYAFAVQITTAAFTAVLTLYLARVLRPAEFGVFSLALSIGGILLLPSDFGVSQSVARFMAERRSDHGAVVRLMSDGLRLKLLFAGGTCVAMVAAAGPVADAYDEPALGWTMRWMAVAVLGQSLMQLYGGAFSGLAMTSRSFRMVLSKSVVETGASIAFVAAGAGAAGAASGRSIGYVVGALVGAVTWLAVFHPWRHSADPSKSVGTRRIVGYATAILVVESAYTLFQQVDVLLIGAFMTATAVGLFQAPLRLVAFLHYPGYALAGGVAPRLAGDDEGRRVDAFKAAVRYITLFQMALVAPVVVWADPIINVLLGSEYAESAEVLRALAPYIFLTGLAPLVSLSANYLGQAGRRVPIAIATVLVNLGIDIVLIPKIGIIAGAIGTCVAYSIYVPAQLAICVRTLNVGVGPMLVTFARTLLAAAAMAGILALFGTSADVAIPWLLVGGLAGLVVYGAMLLATRELSLAELRAAPGAIRQRLGR